MPVETKGPLTGLRVLDLAIVIAGSMGGTLMADFGADVVKVERPGAGDPLRTWGPFKDGVSLWWKAHNRNKRCITLNMAKPDGQAVFKELVAKSDVVIESFQAGTLEKWGLGYDALSKVNPGVVLVRISGFGQDGPYKDRPGFGTIAEAMSGMVHITGFPDQPPILPAWPMADEIAGTFGCMSAMMALYERQKSGKGQFIDVSLYEPLFRMQIPQPAEYAASGTVRGRMGNELADGAPRNLYETSDGKWVSLSANSQGIFEALMKTIGRPELITDARFEKMSGRLKNRVELNKIVGDWIKARPMTEVLTVLQKGGCVAGPVYDTKMVFEDPHYKARNDIVTVPDPEVGSVTMTAAIPKFSRTPGAVCSAGPRLGQHNEEVLREWLGYDAPRVAKLKTDGII